MQVKLVLDDMQAQAVAFLDRCLPTAHLGDDQVAVKALVECIKARFIRRLSRESIKVGVHPVWYMVALMAQCLGTLVTSGWWWWWLQALAVIQADNDAFNDRVWQTALSMTVGPELRQRWGLRGMRACTQPGPAPVGLQCRQVDRLVEQVVAADADAHTT
jgi:hypothetical protein